MVMSAGASVGIRKSLPLLMGICVGFTLMLLLVGLGFGQLFTRFPELHMFITVSYTHLFASKSRFAGCKNWPATPGSRKSLP